MSTEAYIRKRIPIIVWSLDQTVSHCVRQIKKKPEKKRDRFPHSLIVPTKYFKWSAAKLWWHNLSLHSDGDKVTWKVQQLLISSLHFFLSSVCHKRKRRWFWKIAFGGKPESILKELNKVRRNMMLSHRNWLPSSSFSWTFFDFVSSALFFYFPYENIRAALFCPELSHKTSIRLHQSNNNFD